MRHTLHFGLLRSYPSTQRLRFSKMRHCTTSAPPKQQTNVWSGNASQQEFMMKDTCIVVDEKDKIIGSKTKKENRLLLQKRATEKFTFPDHWTNTCCSHPLYGFTPTEVDKDENITNGAVPGAKTAAIRKLGHELGIPSSQLSISDFKYLTRLHYCAPDVQKAGNNWSWGEHEMDYILFIQKSVDLQPNPEEVNDVRYVTQQELREMIAADSGLKWSPWFRIIFKNFLQIWWNDLPRVFTSDAHVDIHTIHRLDVT